MSDRIYVASRRDLDEAILDAVREILPWAIERLPAPEPAPPDAETLADLLRILEEKRVDDSER